MNSAASQRGAAAVFVAISLAASLAALALSLDLGRLYFTHRDLQKMADMAALDAARAAGGCVGDVEDDPQAAAAAEAASSLQRNGGLQSYLSAGVVELGRQVVYGGVRTFVADDDIDAVRVTLRRPFPPRLIPLFSTGSEGTLSASAAATMRPIVSLDVRSSLANLDSSTLNNLFSQLLGGDVNIDVLSFRGLFDATVSLGDLELAAGAGTLERFLETQVAAPDFLNFIADALADTIDAAARTTLQALAAGSDVSRQVVPAELLGLPAGIAADEAVVNVGALVTALAQAANGENLLNLPIDLNLPLLTGENTTLTLRLIEPARAAVGPAGSDEAGNPETFANTAQALLRGEVELLPVLGNPVTLSFYVKVADATATVAGLECAQRGRPQPVVEVDTRTELGELGIGEFVDVNLQSPETQPTTLINLVAAGIPLRITAQVSAGLGDDQDQRLEFEGPFPSEPEAVGTPPAEAIASALQQLGTSIELKVVGADGNELAPEVDALVQPLVQPVLALLTPQLATVLSQLDDSLLSPLLEGLGVTAGAAWVSVQSVTGDQPVLFAR
jgi:uncharacterized membrane protein